MNLLLVRHGETLWNQERRYQGQQDSQLSKLGITQAEQTGIFLAKQKIDHVYTSDLARASFTAEKIAAHHKLTAHKDKRLREISFGVWEGLTRDEVKARYSDLFYARYNDSLNTRIPGGELPREVVERLTDFVEEITSKHQNQTVVAVSHGGALRMLIAEFLHIPLENSYRLHMHNAGISRFYYRDTSRQSQWEAVFINCTAHLSIQV